MFADANATQHRLPKYQNTATFLKWNRTEKVLITAVARCKLKRVIFILLFRSTRIHIHITTQCQFQLNPHRLRQKNAVISVTAVHMILWRFVNISSTSFCCFITYEQIQCYCNFLAPATVFSADSCLQTIKRHCAFGRRIAYKRGMHINRSDSLKKINVFMRLSTFVRAYADFTFSSLQMQFRVWPSSIVIWDFVEIPEKNHTCIG